MFLLSWCLMLAEPSMVCMLLRASMLARTRPNSWWVLLPDRYLQTGLSGHCNSLLTCHLQIRENFYGIPAPIVIEFVRNCVICASKQKLQTKAPLKTIICNKYRGRVQIDLIDFTKYPWEDNKWCLTSKDHFSRFVHAWPLKRKSAQDVVDVVSLICSTYVLALA